MNTASDRIEDPVSFSGRDLLLKVSFRHSLYNSDALCYVFATPWLTILGTRVMHVRTSPQA